MDYLDTLEYNSALDKGNTTSRLAIYSNAFNNENPVLFRHYLHNSCYDREAHNGKVVRNGFCTLFILCDVSFNFLTNDNAYSPHYGNAVVFREMEPYTVFFKNNTPTDYYEFDFPIEFFKNSSHNNLFSDLFYNRKSGTQNMIELDSQSMNEITAKLNIVEHLISSSCTNADLLAYSYLIQIFWLIDSCAKKDNNAIVINKMTPILKEAIDFISKNYTTIEGLDEIALHCHVSKSYLCRVFKKALSCTPGDFILNLKISHAKYLLRNNFTVLDACYKSGFNTYTYFISNFKKHTGTTPFQYQKG